MKWRQNKLSRYRCYILDESKFFSSAKESIGKNDGDAQAYLDLLNDKPVSNDKMNNLFGEEWDKRNFYKDKFLAQLMQVNGGITIGCMKLKEEERARMTIWLAREEMLEAALI